MFEVVACGRYIHDSSGFYPHSVEPLLGSVHVGAADKSAMPVSGAELKALRDQATNKEAFERVLSEILSTRPKPTQ